MILAVIIKRIRIFAFFLFLSSFLALVGSVLFHNFLNVYKFNYGPNYLNYLKEIPNSSYQILCNYSNNYCTEDNLYINFLDVPITKLTNCNSFEVEKSIFIDDKKYLNDDVDLVLPHMLEDNIKKHWVKEEFKGKDFILNRKNLSKKDPTCIKNHKILSNIHSIFPYFLDFTGKLRTEGLNLATGDTVNPFINGETSISNLVKRYPINFIFKPLLYLAVIFMIFYWVNYNKVFYNFTNKKINLFYVFGIASAIFLFLHIIFLGMDNIESKIFKNIRKLIIILFILCELLAQVFLAKNIFSIREKLIKFCNIPIIYLKVIFVLMVILITIFVLFILAFFNLPSKIDYILEWNYFLFLLVFYFLSFLMWKKQ